MMTDEKKSGQQGPQEKSEPEDLPFGRCGSAMQRSNKGRNESVKEASAKRKD
jgi:hypothetical protein